MPPDRRTIDPDHRPGSFGDQLQLCNLARAFSYAGDAAFDTSSAVCLRSPLSTMPAAETQDLAVVVEASLRLHRATVFLNVILIALAIVLILLTAALVYTAEFSVPS